MHRLMYSFWISLHLVDHSGWQFQFYRSWFYPLKRIGNWAVKFFLEHADERKIYIPLKIVWIFTTHPWNVVTLFKQHLDNWNCPTMKGVGGGRRQYWLEWQKWGLLGTMEHLKLSFKSLVLCQCPSSLSHKEWMHPPFKWWYPPFLAGWCGEQSTQYYNTVIQQTSQLFSACFNVDLSRNYKFLTVASCKNYLLSPSILQKVHIVCCLW